MLSLFWAELVTFCCRSSRRLLLASYTHPSCRHSSHSTIVKRKGTMLTRWLIAMHRHADPASNSTYDVESTHSPHGHVCQSISRLTLWNLRLANRSMLPVNDKYRFICLHVFILVRVRHLPHQTALIDSQHGKPERVSQHATILARGKIVSCRHAKS